MKAAEIIKHPEFPHVIWDLPPSQKGLLPVASGRGGPLTISYEVHGHGPKHIVWIMGLGGIKEQWQRQTSDFGHSQGDEYSCLIIDNRGIGKSDKPLLRYSTSEMARDIIEVIDHVGWTKKRELNVIGISMGGMIAQELAFVIPDRIATLCLLSTAARLVNTVGYVQNLRDRINLLRPKSLDAQLAHTRHTIYTDSWLVAPDELPYTVEPFPTNGDRFAAFELKKRLDPKVFGPRGFLSQIVAAGWHHKSAEQLQELADKVGRNRILVVHGRLDRMITIPHGETLISELSAGGKDGEEVMSRIFEDVAHVIPMEKRTEFHKIIEDFVERGRS